jgi:WD40 repeat protein/tRNA A-37 threonylcarbamoyl transferase component Bud32
MADSTRDGLDQSPNATRPNAPPHLRASPNGPADTEPLDDGHGPVPAPADLPPTDPVLLRPEATPTTGDDGAGAAHVEARPGLFGDYELLRLIARGGMGAVYKARQKKLRRTVALKMILAGRLASDDEVRRFYREAEAVAQLDHPGIVPIYEVGEHEGQHFYSMAYVEGANLEARVRGGGPLPPREAAALVERVAEAVAYAHGRGIIHRDLKPANVLLDRDGQPRVVDFGVARQLCGEGRLTASGQVIGTPNFMPPEQATGSAHVGRAADVYALGALLYFLLTGRPPFHAATPVETLRQVVEQEPVAPRQLNAAVDRDLETVCLACLRKEAARRYPGARALADDLGRFLRGEPIRARPAGRLERLRRWRRRNPAVAALLAAFFLVLALGLALVSWQWQEAVSQRRRAEEKTADEARARAEAEGAASEARQKTADEARARAEAQRLSARLLLERGLGLCQQGQHAGGLLWMVRGLELVPEGADDLRDSLRTMLGAWSAQLALCRLVLPHESGVRAADLSADGRTVATASGEGAWLWDVGSSRPAGQPIPHPGKVRAVALSPDGRLLLTGGDDHIARLWETATGRPVGAPLAHGDAVEHVAFSPDGKLALTGAKDGTARLWDAAGAPVGAPMVHKGPVRAVAFSPDGRLALTGSNDHTAQLWDVPGGQPHGEPLRHEGAVRGVAFSRDGKLLLTGSNDYTARLWDAATGKPLAVFRHTHPVPGVAFRPDGQVLATGSEDRTAREWDVHTGQPVGPPLRHDDEVARVAYSPDGRILLTGTWSLEARLWEAGTGRPAAAPLRSHAGLTTSAFSRDGRTTLTAGDDHTARLWRVPDPLLPVPFPRLPGPVLVGAFSPDGGAVLAAGRDRAWVWKAATGEVLAGPLVHPAVVLAGAFSPDGRTVLTGGADGSAWLWDAASGRRLAGPFRHPDAVWAVAFRPDGKAFAIGSGHSVKTDGHMKGNGEARVWDLASGEVLRTVPCHARDTLAVAFTPDGRTLVTASKDATARFWDADTGREAGETIRHRGWVNAVALSPDGRAVLTASDDTTARLWAVPDARPLTTPLRHPRPVKAVAVSADGRLLMTGSEDGTAQLWDARLGQPAGEPFRPLVPLTVAAFSPAGRVLLTGDRDGGLRLWRVPAPLGGDAAHIRLWIEVTSGTELDESGALRPLDLKTWDERRRRLDQLGGPPPGVDD